MIAEPALEGATERALKPLLFSKFERRLRRAELGAYVATMVSTMVAVVAIIGAVRQMGEARKIEREATAYEAFDAYLRLALECLQLSCRSTQPQYGAIIADETAALRQSFFFGVMLSAAEHILQARRNDDYWRDGV
jgi:hypothetical protein